MIKLPQPSEDAARSVAAQLLDEGFRAYVVEDEGDWRVELYAEDEPREEPA